MSRRVSRRASTRLPDRQLAAADLQNVLGGVDIQDILNNISDEYKVSNFVSLPTVVRILAAPNRDEEVEKLDRQLALMHKLMGAIVDGYYGALSASISNKRHILDDIVQAQENVSSVLHHLEVAKPSFSIEGHDLSTLALQYAEFDHTLQLLEKVRAVRQFPEDYARFMASKHFLHAAHCLARTLSLLCEEALLQVPAIADLRTYVFAQKNAFHDVAVAELAELLYQRPQWSSTTLRGRCSGGVSQMSEDLSRSAHSPAELAELVVESVEVLQQARVAVNAIMQQVQPELAQLVETVRDGVVAACVAGVRTPAADHSRKAVRDMAAAALARLGDVLENHIILHSLFLRKDATVFPDQHEEMTVSSNVLTRVCHLGERSSDPNLASFKPLASLYSLNTVWEAMQLEMRALLERNLRGADITTAMDALEDDCLLESDASLPSHSHAFVFKFTNSTAFSSIRSISADAALRETHDLARIQPSPYHATAIYHMCEQFCVRSEKLLADKAALAPHEPPCLLMGFLNDTLLTSLLMQLKADMTSRVNAVIYFAGPEAYQPHYNSRAAMSALETISKSAGDSPLTPFPDALVQSAADIIALAVELVELVADVGPMRLFFLPLTEGVLQKYLHRSTKKLEELIQNTLVGALFEDEALFALELADAQALGCIAMHTAPAKAAGRPAAPPFDAPAWLARLTSLIGGRAVQAGEVVWDSSKLSSLLCLHVSMAWTALACDVLVTTIASASMPNAEAQQAAPLLSGLSELAASYRQLAYKFAIVMRLEVTAHSYFFLQDLHSSNFTGEVERKGRGNTIEALNKDLLVMEDLFRSLSMPSQCCRCVFLRQPLAIGAFLKAELARFERIDSATVATICRQCWLLQQTVGNVTGAKDGVFDHVRRYYEMLLCTGEELINDVEDQMCVGEVEYTLPELRAVMHHIIADGRGKPAGLHSLEQKFHST